MYTRYFDMYRKTQFLYTMQLHYQILQNAPISNFCVINYTFLYKCPVR